MTPTSAATYYVTKTGNDTNNGSFGSPWLTIQKAANTVVAGDTVFVSVGTYAERIEVNANGTNVAPIIFTADTSGGAVTLGGIYARGTYQNYSGFTLNGTGVPGLQANIYLSAGASNSSFTNITSNGVPGNITQMAGSIGTTSPGPNDCTFDSLTLNNWNYNAIQLVGNGHILRNSTITGSNGWDCIRISGSNQIIRGNTIRHSNPLRNVLGHPDFFQSFATGAAGPIQNNIIENNICIGGADTDPDDDVQLGNMEDQGETGIVKNFTFRNNLFINVNRTINVYPDGFKFYNNTFYRCAGYYGATSPSNFCIIYDNIGTKGKANNLEIRNNIFYQCGLASSPTKGWYGGNAGTGLIIDYNLVVGTGAGTTKTGFQINGLEANGLNGVDPLFVDATAGNFRVQLTSPAVDAGDNLSGTFTTDIVGNARPLGINWDIGAYEMVQTSPTILTQPAASEIVAVTGTANFTVFARGQAPLTYQWKKNDVNIVNGGIVSGATSASLTLTGVGLLDAGTYTVEVNNALGPAVTSTGTVLTVGATAPSITTQPTVTQSVTWGTTVNFTVAATGVPSPGYQWKKDGVNLIDGGLVSGSTSSTLTLTGVTGSYAGTYTVVVDNTVPPSVTSNSSVLVVNGIPVAITSQPASQSVLLGNPVSFAVSATGTPAPTFQWNKNNVPIPGATGSSYTIGSSTANDAGSYSVTVTNIVGSITSAAATLSVSVVPVPTITSQPVALTVAAGRNVSFQINTTDAVSFQWQESINGGTTWSNLSNDATYSGVTGKTLTIANAPLTLNGRLYRAQAGNGTGGATSNAVTLGVTTPVFPSPVSVVVSPTGNLVVNDRTQNVIQNVNAQRVANLLAGVANQQGSTNGNGNVALFRQPGGAVLDSAGNLYVADTGNSMIRKITPTGSVSTLAGSASNQSYRDGNGTDAWFNSPSSVAIDGGGNLYVADTGNSVIRKIDATGNVTTFAGTAGVRGSVDGNGPAARFNQPTGIAADTGGNLFVADTLNQVIRKISPNGAVSTLAGLTGVSGSADGTGADALFNNPLGVAVDNLGNIYVSDSGNATIRRISSTGVVSTYAGLPTISGLMDGTGLDAWFNQPMGLGMDSAGNLYVADNGNAAVRRISSGRVVNTLVITQGTTPIPTPPPTTPTTPTPTPPTSPTPAPSSGSGGGGAPSLWFVAVTSLLYITRRSIRRQPAIDY